jgi:hypothetical protein
MKDAARIHDFTRGRAPFFFDDETTDIAQIATHRP